LLPDSASQHTLFRPIVTMQTVGRAPPSPFGYRQRRGTWIYCGARFPGSICSGGAALLRLALNRLATVACFGALALAVTACSTFSHAARPDALQVAGPPRTIEAVLPADAEPAGSTATSPEGDHAPDPVAAQVQSTPETPALEEGM